MARENPAWHHPLNAPTPVHGPIAVVPYDPTWPQLFERERPRIGEPVDAAFG